MNRHPLGHAPGVCAAVAGYRARWTRSAGGTVVVARGHSGAALLVVHPALAQAHLDGGDDADDEEEQPGEGRGVAHVEELEPLLEEVHDVEEHGVGARPTVGCAPKKIVYTSVNSCSEAIVLITTMKKIVPLIIGTRDDDGSDPTGEAPSIAAASYRVLRDVLQGGEEDDDGGADASRPSS